MVKSNDADSTWTKHDGRLWTEPLTVTLKPELENSILVFCHSLIIIQLKTVFLKTRLVLPHKILDLDNMQINKC